LVPENYLFVIEINRFRLVSSCILEMSEYRKWYELAVKSQIRKVMGSFLRWAGWSETPAVAGVAVSSFACR
jgi:hypothetical protein